VEAPVVPPAPQLDASDRQSVRASITASKENLNISVQTPTRQSSKKKGESSVRA